MTVLVTGGAGFIGSTFIDGYLERHPQDHVVCLDALTYAGNRRSLAGAEKHPNFTFVLGDVTDRAGVSALLSRLRRQGRPVEVVVHFAAETHVDNSIRDSRVFAETNLLGTQTLLDLCLEHGIGRFHQVSTDEVYGDLPLDEGEPPFTEQSPLRPRNPYSASKAAGDMMALAYHSTHGLHVTVSRCGNNLGPRQHPEKLIPLALLRGAENREIPVYGTGENVRDWIDVADHCRALECILARGRAGEVYNIGAGQTRTNLQVIHTLLTLLGREKTLIHFVTDRPGHDRRYALSTAKLERELGWRPKLSFDQSLAQTVDWYLGEEGKWWLEGIKS